MRCEVGNHAIGHAQQYWRCYYCRRVLCQQHVGNQYRFPGALVFCVDHVRQVQDIEVELHNSRERAREQSSSQVTYQGSSSF